MNKHAKTFWQGKGFYLALALVVSGAALASFFAVNSMLDNLGFAGDSGGLKEEGTTWDTVPDTQVENKQTDIPVQPSASSQPLDTGLSSTAPSASSAVYEEPVELQPVQAPSFVSPMAGGVSQVFSGDELVFNQTMQDWRTHNGLDLAGAINIGVHAPSNATVAAVYEDPQWGGVVELTSGDVTIRLCGVKETRVSVGDTVQQGDTLAVLGEVPAESAETVHLHVEFLQQGQYVNPEEYFSVS